MKEDDEDSWTKQVDTKLQLLLGSTTEHSYFRVMHHGGHKVLWHRPEDYEHACGVEVSEEVKKEWFRKTGKAPLRWMVTEDADAEEWVSDEER
jgi:hypothetical protein